MNNDLLFQTIERHHGDGAWGRILDAGTGSHSLRWVSQLECDDWTAVTAELRTARELTQLFGAYAEPPNRIVVGSWDDPDLLAEEKFDVVLADYLLGSMEMCSPYFQDRILERLLPHVAGCLYVVGLEPFPKFADSQGRELIQQIISTRDACFLLAGDRPYREYPEQWVVRQLEASGYVVEDARNFTNIYGATFVETQLNVATQQLAYVSDPDLQRALHARLETLAQWASQAPELQDGIRWGKDYVLVARPRVAP